MDVFYGQLYVNQRVMVAYTLQGDLDSLYLADSHHLLLKVA
jgi:hypothetical protein